MAYGYNDPPTFQVQVSDEARDALDHPFEFDEVLVDRDTRRAMVRVGKISGDFASAEAPMAQSPLPTRKLAVRLRTINNACEAPFRMHDGRHITEVSMDGSRDRQYLVGPYQAVRRLMKGDWPWDETLELQRKLSETCDFLKGELDPIKAFLEDPEGKGTETQVAATYQDYWRRALEARKQEPLCLVDRDRIMKSARTNTRLGLGIDLAPEQLREIREYSALLAETINELTLLKSQIEAADWYWGWSAAKEALEMRINELGKAHEARRGMLRGPDWPKPRFTSDRNQKLCAGFSE
jgi:hypothetical protein